VADKLMTLPNLVVIGAAKCGTTALYQNLRQHPQIYMSPVKEPRFFAFEKGDLNFRGPGDAELHRSSIIDLEDYQALFREAAGEKAIGEASPVYLCAPKTAARMQALVPDVRLIAILRHPVERAYSHYLHLIRDGVEPLTDFAQALAAEEARVRDNWEYRWRYRELGCYSTQLARFFERFDRRQIKVYLYEEFNSRPQQVLCDIYRFLGVDESFVADTSVRYNASGVPRNKLMHAVLSRLQKATQATFDDAPQAIAEHRTVRAAKLGKSPLVEQARRIGIGLKNRNLVKPPLAPEVRAGLLADYRGEVLALKDLLQRDLAHWLR
jgi:hypothetical protein